jgi:hypothetical protein
MIKALQDPILDDGIPFTAYFNGRLLASEDLARDQQGHRDARRRLARRSATASRSVSKSSRRRARAPGARRW